jgi:hypothetical protein
VIAFLVRFYRINHPDQVVFDEVHFGSFAGQYLRREYYFDVHPPLAKMLNGLAGYLVGFRGEFGFNAIGDDYIAANVSGLGPDGSHAVTILRPGTVCRYEEFLRYYGRHHCPDSLRNHERVGLPYPHCRVLCYSDSVRYVTRLGQSAHT